MELNLEQNSDKSLSNMEQQLPKILQKIAMLPGSAQKSWLQCHHLGGLFYFLYSKSGKSDWQNQWMQNEVHSRELRKLSHPTIHPVILKGMALLDSYYPHYGCRYMSDIDLLLDQSQLKSYSTHLQNFGYKEVSTSKWQGNNFKSQWQKTTDSTQVHIELHSKLFYHTKNEDWNLRHSNTQGYQVLEKEDQLIHLLGHAGFQHTFSKAYWLIDSYYFILKEFHDLNWDYIFDKAMKLRLKNSVFAGLYLLSTEFSMQNLKLILNKYEHLEPTLLISELHESDLLKTTSFNSSYYILKHLLKDSLGEAIKYDGLWIYHKLKKRK